MRKTALTAAGLALGVVSMAGIAYAAGPSGPVATLKTPVTSTVDDRGGDRHGADDPVRHEFGIHRGDLRSHADDRAGRDRRDDRGGMATAAHIVSRTSPARAVTVPAASVGHRVSDDPAGHDATDDRGSSGRHGADDPSGHDTGDDHGSRGHGSDD